MRQHSWFAVVFRLLIYVVPASTLVNAHSVGPQNRFHLPLTEQKSKAALAWTNNANATFPQALPRQAGLLRPKVGSNTAPRTRPVQRAVTPPVGKFGFVSGSRIPAGDGQSMTEPVKGDFNGDGKPDAAMIIANNVNNNWVYSVSTVLGNGDGTFQAAQSTPVPNGDYCVGFVVGDVNGDKKDDVLVLHNGGGCNGNVYSSFDVLISNGDGTFTAIKNYAFSSNSLAGGALLDVNGDGKPDVVAVDAGMASNVITLLGNGDGTFQAPTQVALPEQIRGATVEDFNGDGFLDVAGFDNTSGELTVYLATSPSTYGAQTSVPTSNGIYAGCTIAVGDLTGDGKPEIVTPNGCNSGNNDLTVYVNNGDGSFQAGISYNGAMSAPGAAANIWPLSITIADVNGDNKADIISTNDGSSDITVLLGNGDGTVRVPATGYALGGFAWAPVIVDDFNGDGLLDILASDNEFHLVLLHGYGDGTFRAALNYYAPLRNGYALSSIASGDFNGDGIPDFVVGNSGDSSVGITVFLSRPDGSMQPGVNYDVAASNGYLLCLVVADFNKDGRLDIAAADSNNGIVRIFTGNADGTFALGTSFPTDSSSSSPQGLVTADFNKDGYPDLAVINSSGNVGVLLNDGTGNFANLATIPLSSQNSYQVTSGDLNNDGNPDLVVPLSNGNAVALLLGNGDGTFQPEADVTVGNVPSSVVIADLNGDGKQDLAVTIDDAPLTGGVDAQGVAVALGNGDGTFQPATLFPSTLQSFPAPILPWWYPFPSSVTTADVDGDGKLDLVYVNNLYGTVGVLFGQGNGSFYGPVEYAASAYVSGLAVADVNQDGALDVVATSSNSTTMTVLLNANGSATRATYTVTATSTTATVTAGNSAIYTITITPSNHDNGTITFSCSNTLPPLASCSFDPPSVILDGHTPVNVQVTITTKAPAASMQARANSRRSPAMLLAGMSGMGLVGVVLLGGVPRQKHWASVLLGALLLTMAFSLVACGGGQGSTNTPPPGKTATTTTVTSSQSTVLVGTAVTFTGRVTASSGSPTGTVTFLDGTTQLGTGTISSGAVTFQTSSLAAGTHNITAAYGGDTNFSASTSSALSQTVNHPGTPAGAYTVTVTAAGTAGTNNGDISAHPINLTLTVQ